MRYCVAGLGRCGTTLVERWLGKRRGDMKTFKTHLPPPLKFSGKMIFLFGNPYNIVLSTHFVMQNPKEHYQNFGKDYHSSWKDFMITDTLNLEFLFDIWHKEQSFPLITVRYETMWQNLDKISKFFDADLRGFPNKIKRVTDWKNYEMIGDLTDFKNTYSSLKKKIDEAEDFKEWKVKKD